MVIDHWQMKDCKEQRHPSNIVCRDGKEVTDEAERIVHMAGGLMDTLSVDWLTFQVASW